MGRFSDDEVERELRRFLEVQYAQDWNGMCDFFTEDAVYVEHALGTFVGREAIRDWLVPVMAPLVGWTYPTKWILVGDDRAVHYWGNVMPTPEGDSGTYAFSGITVVDYAGDGQWSREEDIYNEVEMRATLDAWLAAGGKFGGA
jgi:ketosteroid isomerase-like protein